MTQLLFRNWKFALLWVVGTCAMTAAFFMDGGGHDRLEEGTQQIRDTRNEMQTLSEQVDQASLDTDALEATGEDPGTMHDSGVQEGGGEEPSEP